MESVQKVTYNINLGSPVTIFRLSEEGVPQDPGKRDEELSCESMGEELSNLTQAKEYISQMQSRLDAMKKELHDLRRKNSALQMQQFVSEEKNDLLDYLRSLTPEKVAELSESSCPGVQEEIHSVVHGLLATLSPKIHSKAPPPKENTAGGALNLGGEDDDCAEPVENASLPFQPLISVPRDYLARLLFWCMLFETAMFTDIPLRIEWKCLAEKWWRWRLHWIRCPKDALKLVLLSYSFYCSSCKVRKRPFGCKVSLTYGCTIFSFSFFILCCIRKENLVVPCC